MRCTPIPGGGFICDRRGSLPKCSVPGCHESAPFECDFELQLSLGGGAAKTCDKRLCARHATVVPEKKAANGDRYHLCPPHLKLEKKAAR